MLKLEAITRQNTHQLVLRTTLPMRLVLAALAHLPDGVRIEAVAPRLAADMFPPARRGALKSHRMGTAGGIMRSRPLDTKAIDMS